VRLAPEADAAGYRLIARDATQSTNDDASAAARAGDPGRLWIVAGEQRAGRGRYGRTWVSPRGNLYASLLLVDPCEPAVAPQLGFIAGLALHEAVAAETGLAPPRLALKWPNDLLLDGAKTAGLLLEGHQIRGGAFAVVIGFGVNVAAAPGDASYPAAALGSAADLLTAEALFRTLSRCMADRLDAWRRVRAHDPDDAFRTVRTEWLARAAGLGETVTVRLPTGARSGSFQGLDEAGRLQLRTPAGAELIDAGDLFFPASLTAGAPAAASGV
jgi:BirA family transcriptional regulator, biotin operon repressor / biotin---[acetyl-CoA-carboxylase] ligase